jgi:glycosyltransferase involved in cell wall biosynthesis
VNKIVSVILPVYNCERYLVKCLDSILTQTYKSLEVIIINDGSSDSSREIAERYTKQDKRIKLVNQGNNGVSASRNVGLKNSIGKYVLFIDSDDYIENNMIEFLINSAEKYNAQITASGLFIEESSSDHIRKTWESIAFNGGENIILNNEELKRIFPEKLSTTGFRAVFAKLYRLDYIKQNNAFFDPEISLGEDYLFNLPLFRNIDRYVYVTKPLYHYNTGYSNNTLSRKYRADLFEIGLKIFNATRSILNSWNTDQKHFDRHLYELLFNHMRLVFENEASLCNTNTYFKKLQRLISITNQKEVKDLTSQKSFRPIGYKSKFIFYMLKLKLLPLLLLVRSEIRAGLAKLDRFIGGESAL